MREKPTIRNDRTVSFEDDTIRTIEQILEDCEDPSRLSNDDILTEVEKDPLCSRLLKQVESLSTDLRSVSERLKRRVKLLTYQVAGFQPKDIVVPRDNSKPVQFLSVGDISDVGGAFNGEIISHKKNGQYVFNGNRLFSPITFRRANDEELKKIRNYNKTKK